MTQDNSNIPVGSDRLEEMTGDRRKGKKLPGPSFWFLFCILFIAACFLFGWIFGGLVRSGINSLKNQSGDSDPAPIEAPSSSKTRQPALPSQDERAGLPELSEESGPEKSAAAVHSSANAKKPKTIGETDIYLDEDGVWRNLNRGAAEQTKNAGRDIEKTAAPAPPGLISAGAKLLGGSGADGSPGSALAMSIISGLFSSEEGFLQQNSDFSKIAGQISAGLLNPGQGGPLFQFDGDLSKTMEQITGGQAFRKSAPEGLAHDDPLHEIRRKMAAQAREDERRIRELKSQMGKNRPANRIENFEGFERFDPKDAKKITSAWEYFDDPR